MILWILEFTPLEFETFWVAVVGFVGGDQNLLRWSLKPFSDGQKVYLKAHQNLLRWSLKRNDIKHKQRHAYNQNLLRWSLKPYLVGNPGSGKTIRIYSVGV